MKIIKLTDSISSMDYDRFQEFLNKDRSKLNSANGNKTMKYAKNEEEAPPPNMDKLYNKLHSKINIWIFIY